MKKTRIMLSLALILWLLLGMAPAGVLAGGSEPVTLTMWIHEGYTGYVGRWGKDPISAYITEKTGVTFDIMTGDGTNDDTKLNMMINAGNTPDIIITTKTSNVAYPLQNENAVQDISKLAYEYKAENLIRLLEECESFNLKFQRYANGNYWAGSDAPLYVWPDYFVDKYTYENYRLNTIQERDCWISRKDIYYDKMGAPVIKTIDDLTAYFKAVRDMELKDINGNPIAVLGLQPAPGLIDTFAAIFSGTDKEIIRLEDGRIVNNYELPAYKEALVYLNMLYRENILDQEIFTETYDQWREKLIAGGIGTMVMYYWHVDGANAILKDTEYGYWAMPSENTPRAEGIDVVAMNHGWNIGVEFGWRSTMISETCKDTAAAIRFLDFMYSHEGQMLAWFGLPGEYYSPVEAWDAASLPALQSKELHVEQTAQYAADKDRLGADFAKETGLGYWMFWCIHGYREFQVSKEGGTQEDPYTTYAREQVLKLSNYDLKQCMLRDVKALSFANDETKLINKAIGEIRTRWTAQIVMADSEEQARANYDAMIQEMEGAGLKELDANYAKIYEEIMKPLIGE